MGRFFFCVDFFENMINEKQAEKYCCENVSLIENYSEAVADQTQTWDCHHRGEVLPCGNYSIAQLKKYGLYYDRPAFELVFLTKAEHRKLHFLGKHLSAEHRAKMSAAQKGKHLSAEHRAKLSAAQLGKCLSAEHRAKTSAALKGRQKTVEHKKNISKANIGCHFWNNGQICVRSKECPEGFVPGMLKKSKIKEIKNG